MLRCVLRGADFSVLDTSRSSDLEGDSRSKDTTV
ncbi:hypothetical protein PF003_g12648 [Phytophthora fragariae]|nr:hypothetical protein PF003_g12648 [Phytophthora fragariae]